MTTFSLKSYQQTALDALATFARSAQLKGPALAFAEHVGRPYNADPFGEVPCVCLRIPTGGGKTLMAAHAIEVLAQELRATDAPVVVWLVPSDAIRSQTLKALQTKAHPYREALESAYGSDVRVCVLDDLHQIAPIDWGKRAVVVVATIQSFPIDDTDRRNVYSFFEDFERHFMGVEDHRLRVLQSLPDAVVTAQEAQSDTTGVLRGFVGLDMAKKVNDKDWGACQFSEQLVCRFVRCWAVVARLRAAVGVWGSAPCKQAPRGRGAAYRQCTAAMCCESAKPVMCV